MKIKIIFVLSIIFTMLFNSMGIHTAFSANEEKTYLIGLKKEVDINSFMDKKGINSKKVKKFENYNLFVSSLKLKEALELQNSSEVDYIEEDVSVEMTSIGKIDKTDSVVKNLKNDSQTMPWGMKAIGVNHSIDSKYEGKHIKIAIIDTGINNHPDLKITGGVSFVEEVSSYNDDNGHGTHVAGTVAALNNKTGVVGAASKSDIYAVKVLNKNGTGTISQVIEGIQWSIDNKINIISMSLGSQENSRALHEVIQEANHKGILVIAAAGNRGKGSNTLLYPANYPEVLSVGGTDETHKRANFSSTGPFLDIVAPGVDILSTTSDGEYGLLSGTSMATPHVTGAAASIWAKNSNLTNQEVETILLQSATPLGDRNEYGRGIINLAKALGIIETEIVTPNPDIPQSEPTEEPNAFNIRAYDQSILALSKQLNFLKEQALLSDNIELAKEIENKYNDLLVRNAAIHKIPDEYTTLAKDDTKTEALINDYHSSNYAYYNLIQKEYEEAIAHYSSMIPSTSSQDVSIAAYGYTGDGQRIYPGLSATVSLKLYQPKDLVYIKVYNSAGTFITGETYPSQTANSSISYTWRTSSSTPIGPYMIKYTYYGSNEEDTFVIHVDPPVVPGIPIGLTTDPNTNSITLNWTPVTGATYYTLQKDGAYVGTTPFTSYTFTGLNDGTNYTLGVAANNSNGSSSYATKNATTLAYVPPIPKPGIPTELTAVPSTNDITLSWTPVSDASSYFIQKNGVTVDIITATSYTFANLIPGTSYTLGVAAYNSSGTSSFATKSATTLAIPTPTNLSTMSTDTSITLSWSGVSGATSYSLQKNGVTIGNTIGTSYTFTSLTPNTTYTLGVAATTANGTSSYVTKNSTTQPSGMQVLQLNNPVDVSLGVGVPQVYKFTPTTSGAYKLFTGPYGGTGSSNDTVLELYSDASLTSQIAYNDDSNGTYFSELKINLTAGLTYYVKLRPWSSYQSLHARLTVTPEGPTISGLLAVDVPVDVVAIPNEFKVYKFTPARDGEYKFITSYLSSDSDTYLHLYDDPNLTNEIAYNDDADLTRYSEIQIELKAGKDYYVKFRGWNNNSANARLTVSNIWYQVNLIVDGEQIIDSAYGSARQYGPKYYVNGYLGEEDTSVFRNTLISDGLIEGTDFLYDSNSDRVFIETDALENSNNANSFEVTVTASSVPTVQISVIDSEAVALVPPTPPPGEPWYVESTSEDDANVKNTSYQYTFIISAGIASKAPWYPVLRDRIKAEYGENNVKIILAFPYNQKGVNTKGLLTFAFALKQIAKILDDHDGTEYGAGVLKKAIKNEYESGKLILIGHSAGGFASFETMKSIEKDSTFTTKVSNVIQIGSPVSIAGAFKSRVVNIRDLRDPVPMIHLAGMWTSDDVPKDIVSLKVSGLKNFNGFIIHESYFKTDTTWGAIPTTNLNETFKVMKKYIN
jgi:hypothetical protein